VKPVKLDCAEKEARPVLAEKTARPVLQLLDATLLQF